MLLLIDVSGFVHRAFYALPSMRRADGVEVGAVYGFTRMLFGVLTTPPAPTLALAVLDRPGPTFRSAIYPSYKAQRSPKPPEMVAQFEMMHEAVAAFGLATAGLDGYEADDLIATYEALAARRGLDVTIVSSDKDLMQLVSDSTYLYCPIKRTYLGHDDVVTKFGVPPRKVIDVQALAGDATDNVPGVPGIGLKGAADLINQYGDLDTLLARSGEIAQRVRRGNLTRFADQARMSRQLVTLKRDCPVVEPDPNRFGFTLDTAGLRRFCERHEFASLLTLIDDHLGQEAA